MDSETQSEEWLPQDNETFRGDIIVMRLLWKLKKFFRLNAPIGVSGLACFTGKLGTYLICRVAEVSPRPISGKRTSSFGNLIDLFKRFTRCRFGSTELRIDYGDFQIESQTNDLGYFSAYMPGKKRAKKEASLQIKINSKNFEPDESLLNTSMDVVVVPSETPLLIISDVDDTIIHSAASDFLQSIIIAIRTNFLERPMVEGMSDVYQNTLKTIKDRFGLAPKFFYVTSSSWSLHGLIFEWLKVNRFPLGPILMQRIGLKQNKLWHSGHGHKLSKIQTIMQICPDIPVVLIGDNGQEDEKIYTKIYQQYSSRVEGIFIRKVKANRKSLLDERTDIPIRYFENKKDIESHFALILQNMKEGSL